MFMIIRNTYHMMYDLVHVYSYILYNSVGRKLVIIGLTIKNLSLLKEK